MDDKYFAVLPKNEIGAALLEKKDEYYQYLEDSGRRQLLLKSFKTLHAPALAGGDMWSSGSSGEYVNISVNHYRNLSDHRLVLTTSQRPSFEPKAINTDSKSQKQVAIAQGLLEYYERVKKMERFTNTATGYAINYGEGFVGCFWNPTKGDAYGVGPDGKSQANGDLEFDAFHTFDVIRAPRRQAEDEQSWIMVRRYRNKWDLAAKFPDLADRITNYQDEDDTGWRNSFSYNDRTNRDKDMIPVYSFFHRKSEALPEGRIVEFTAADIMYADGPLPYYDIPIYRIAPSEQPDLIFGYTNFFDLLPLQSALDKEISTVITNHAAYGVQNIGVPKGGGMNVTQLAGGMNLVEFDAKLGPPIPLNFTATPAEVFKNIEDLKRDMETLSGVNSVARGNPQSKDMSGTALALIQSTAIQFAQGLQMSYAQLLEDVGTSVIKILQEYATTPRVALIAGKSNRSNLLSFKNDDISNISRVVVDMGNPIMRTTGGRVNLAEQLISNGLIDSAEQYIEVLTSGRLEPVYESERAELLLIRSENEEMQNGVEQPVIATDNHDLHIKEHKCVLASPDVRRNAAVVEAVLGHIAEHQSFLPPPVAVDPNGNPLPPEAGGPQVNAPTQAAATAQPPILGE